MKPGHLEVFDGLRITTEHMEHLQEALHSAVQDLREILGLGKVYTGFDVAAEDAQTIIVMPGLAFDLKKNRIVCDEPQTVPVSFAEGTTALYVCARHETVEDGLVENRPTLIWDSCRVVLRPTPPGPDDNLVPLARLDQTEDGTSFTVVRLPEPEAEQAEPAATEEMPEEGEAETNGETAAVEPTEATGEGGEPVESALEEAPAEESPEEQDTQDAEALAPMPPLPATWQIRQGVAHLSTEQDGPALLSALLTGPLLARLNRDDTNGDAVRVTLAEHHVSLDFAPRDLRCLSLLSAILSIAAPPSDDEAPDGAATVLTAQARAEGEATFTAVQTAQHGLSTLEGAGAVIAPQRFALTEEGIAHLPLAALAQASFDETEPSLAGVLPQLSLLVQAAPASETGFILTAKLAWHGTVTEDHLQALETQTAGFSWQAQVAWKSIGAPDPTPT